MESLSKGLMWFLAALITLSTLGFSQIAAAMGKATVSVTLGVSLAVKDLLSHTVAGIYLAKDSDFNNGDQLKAGGHEREVIDVGLMKSRLRLDNGDNSHK